MMMMAMANQKMVSFPSFLLYLNVSVGKW